MYDEEVNFIMIVKRLVLFLIIISITDVNTGIWIEFDGISLNFGVDGVISDIVIQKEGKGIDGILLVGDDPEKMFEKLGRKDHRLVDGELIYFYRDQNAETNYI